MEITINTTPAGNKAFQDGNHTMGATLNTTSDVVKVTKPAMATPINTTSAPVDTKDTSATPLSSKIETAVGVAKTSIPTKKTQKTQKKRKRPFNEGEDFGDQLKRPSKRHASEEGSTSSQHSDDVPIKDEIKDEDEIPTFKSKRKEQKAALSRVNTAPGKVKIKFEEFVNTKPVPPKDRVQTTAPFDFDPNTARGTQPDKEISYHGQATAYVLSAARDPQHNLSRSAISVPVRFPAKTMKCMLKLLTWIVMIPARSSLHSTTKLSVGPQGVSGSRGMLTAL
ncbi:hypothetical protein LTS10_004097 [Elasticomyces elasticus]|nr:hypothetical protein LTS10_004097 [Elasticomyces elasticus]